MQAHDFLVEEYKRMFAENEKLRESEAFLLAELERMRLKYEQDLAGNTKAIQDEARSRIKKMHLM